MENTAPSTFEPEIIKALKTVYDPEIPVDIYELGLVYEIKSDPQGAVTIKMTLTSPNCPEAASIPPSVEAKVKAVPGVSSVKVDLVWEPTWTQEMMSEAAKLQLGLM